MCHVLSVMCHVSRVMCHVSPLTSHLSYANKKKFTLFLHTHTQKCISTLKNGQNNVASRWRVGYQRGIPCLVLMDLKKILSQVGID